MAMKFGPRLRHVLEQPSTMEMLPVRIVFNVNPALEFKPPKPPTTWDESQEHRKLAIDFCKRRSAELQRPIVEILKTHEKSGDVKNRKEFWINNTISIQAKRGVIKELAERKDIKVVELDVNYELKERPIPDAEIRDSRCQPSADGSIVDSESLTLIEVRRVWERGFRGDGVVVAVIDSGLNQEHPDLSGRLWDGGTAHPNHGYNFHDDDHNTDDARTHGTGAAGLVAGDGTCGIRFGPAPESKIMVLRIASLDESGKLVSNIDYFLEAYEFAADHGADVISQSWTFTVEDEYGTDDSTGIPRPDRSAWRRASETLNVARIMHANSAGNNGAPLDPLIPDNVGVPADCPPPWIHPEQASAGVASAIACGATSLFERLDHLLATSSKGPVTWDDYPYSTYSSDENGLMKPDICAPGNPTCSCTVSCTTSDCVEPYARYNDTSAAAPLVAGCLALLVGATRDSGMPLIPAMLCEAIETTAIRLTSIPPIGGGVGIAQVAAKENHSGAGRINIHDAFCYGADRNWWKRRRRSCLFWFLD